MFINKTYKYKLKLTKEQEVTLQSWIHTCRAVYNLALETKIWAYKSIKKNLSCHDLQKQLTDAKKEHEWISSVPSQSLQEVIERMDGAYKKFFSGGGFPRFANRDRYKSVTFKSVALEGYDKAVLPKLGAVKFFCSGLPKGELLRAIITKEQRGYFISITTRQELDIKPISFCSENQAVGIDVGVKFFLVSSDGEYVDNPQFLKSQQKQMRILQRSLARKKSGSIMQKKVKRSIALLHDKIKCQRLDFLHKTANSILSEYDFIAAEKLRLKNMTKSAKGTKEQPGTNVKQKSGLNRSLLDPGFGMFFDIMTYKAMWQGKMFVQVDPRNTSNTCAACGYSNKDNRKSQSEFICLNCGYQENADLNAAENIKRRGTPVFRQREALACA